MKPETKKYTIQFTERVLGQMSADPNIIKEYFIPKSPDPNGRQDEIEAVARPELEDEPKIPTVFGKDATGLFMFDYQIRGFFKEQLGALINLGDPVVKNLSKWLVKGAVDQYLLVSPRKIYFLDDSGHVAKADEMFQRPQRNDTMQGPRVCVALSECLHPEAHPGLSLSFTVELWITPAKGKREITWEALDACMDWSARRGFGQWRTGGNGRFMWKHAD